MKRIYLAILIVLSVSITTGNKANAQTLQTADSSSSYGKNISSNNERNRAENSFPFYNEINSRAIREFLREYDDVPNVKWYKSKRGYVAAFDKDSSMFRLHFNKRGDFEVQLRYFNEDRLNPEIRNMVKGRFDDYNIFQVCEVSAYGNSFYQIKIRDNNHCKVINVIGGEIKVLTKYTDIAMLNQVDDE